MLAARSGCRMADPTPCETPRFSVVVPVFNEERALHSLVSEIRAAMEQLEGTYECIFVDDGSRDGTAGILDTIVARPASPFRCIRFDENRGQGAALYVGMAEARGSIVVVLDGDGQNPPDDIPQLVEALVREDLDLVCGVRVARKDTALRRAMSRIANAVRSRALGDGVRDSGCALKVMRREVVRTMLPMRTLYSFIPALAKAAGCSIGERAVGHRQRIGGRSSYGLRAFLWRPLVDMLGVRWYASRCVLQSSDLVTQNSRSLSHSPTRRGYAMSDALFSLESRPASVAPRERGQ